MENNAPLSCLFFEMVRLTVSRSDSEPEGQRYDMMKDTLTVDPIMLENRRERDNVKNSQKSQSLLIEN